MDLPNGSDWWKSVCRRFERNIFHLIHRMDTTRCVFVVVVVVFALVFLFFFHLLSLYTLASNVHSPLTHPFSLDFERILCSTWFCDVHFRLCICFDRFSRWRFALSYHGDEKILDFEGCLNIEYYFMGRIYRQYFDKSVLLMSGNCAHKLPLLMLGHVIIQSGRLVVVD